MSLTRRRRQTDPLLIELFESVYKELSTALEAEQRLVEQPNDGVRGRDGATLVGKIAKLKTALAALHAAIEQRSTPVLH